MMDEWMDDGWMDGWMAAGWMDGWMDDGWMDFTVFLHTNTYFYISLRTVNVILCIVT